MESSTIKSFKSFLFLAGALLIFISNSNAQENWVLYSHTLSEKGYEGLKFRFKGLVRTEIEDADASARLWVRVELKDGGVGFFYNMRDKPIQSKQWDNYAIEGVIDGDYSQILFGALCRYNGSFYFDDIEFEIKTEDQKWKSIYRADFEDDLGGFTHGVEGRSYGTNLLFQDDLTKANVKSGKQCLVISGTEVPNFGTNSEVGKFAEVNNIKLYYEVYGEGQPLVVLHGNGGSIGGAGSHYPHFIDKKYMVIAVDSRAQGKSGDSEAELTYDLLASDINELLNQLSLDSVYIWGHSDGAIIGLVMGLNHPGKIKKLVAFAPNTLADTTGIEPPIYRWIEKTALTTENPTERKLATMMWKHPNIPFSELKKIQCEVLLMTGDRDFAPLDHTVKIFQNLPKAHLSVIPGSTHSAALEKKGLYLQLVDDFFENPFTMPSTVQRYEWSQLKEYSGISPAPATTRSLAHRGVPNSTGPSDFFPLLMMAEVDQDPKPRSGWVDHIFCTFRPFASLNGKSDSLRRNKLAT